MSKNVSISEFYELVSDVKDEIGNCDDEREISLGRPQDGRDDSNSAIEPEGLHRGTPSTDNEMDIKYEVNDIQLHPGTVDDLDLDKINTSPLKFGSINSEEKELNGFYSDLLLCERDCLTCQMYIRRLSEHVRAIHAVRQPALDPLHIDSLEADKSTAIEIKPEINEDIERMDSSEESDLNFEHEVGSSSDSDPDFNTSRKAKSGQKLPKVCSRKDEIVCQPKIQNGDKPFKCGICGMGFTQKSSLTIHLGRHTGEKSFKCEECGKGFTRKVNLTAHMILHTGGKPFNCEECGKSFTRKDILTRHLLVHTGVRPYRCVNCAKCFKTKTILNDHIRCHTGERPYGCEECGKSFRTCSQLHIHRKSHNKGRPYKCDMCDKDFKRPDVLYGHKKNNCRSNI